MGIANSILEAVQNEMRRYPGAHAIRVGVRIGEVTAIDADALTFCVEALSRDTDLQGLQLVIELSPRRHRCPACDRTFVVRDYDCRCVQCQKIATECISGDELELVYLEVEEDEPSAVGKENS